MPCLLRVLENRALSTMLPLQLARPPRELVEMAEALVEAGYSPTVFKYARASGAKVLQDCCPFDDLADDGGPVMG